MYGDFLGLTRQILTVFCGTAAGRRAKWHARRCEVELKYQYQYGVRVVMGKGS